MESNCYNFLITCKFKVKLRKNLAKVAHLKHWATGKLQFHGVATHPDYKMFASFGIFHWNVPDQNVASF